MLFLYILGRFLNSKHISLRAMKIQVNTKKTWKFEIYANTFIPIQMHPAKQAFWKVILVNFSIKMYKSIKFFLHMGETWTEVPQKVLLLKSLDRWKYHISLNIYIYNREIMTHYHTVINCVETHLRSWIYTIENDYTR